MWVVAIVAFNPYWMLIPYALVGALFVIRLLQIRKKNKLKHLRDITKDFQHPEVSLNREKYDLNLEVKPYFKEINEHLEDGTYKDVRESIGRRNIYIKLHNEEFKEFLRDLQGDIINCIKQRNFVEVDETRSCAEQINFFTKEIINSNILGVVCNNYQAPESISFRIYSHNGFHDLICKYNQDIWIESNDEKRLQRIENEIIEMFDDAIKRKLKFKLLLCYYNKIRIYQTSINVELKRIIDETRIGTTLLKGKCSKCLKQNIFGEINGNT